MQAMLSHLLVDDKFKSLCWSSWSWAIFCEFDNFL